MVTLSTDREKYPMLFLDDNIPNGRSVDGVSGGIYYEPKNPSQK
jgi:hypothetical protein